MKMARNLRSRKPEKFEGIIEHISSDGMKDITQEDQENRESKYSFTKTKEILILYLLFCIILIYEVFACYQVGNIICVAACIISIFGAFVVLKLCRFI